MVDIQESYGKELNEAADKLGTFLDWWDTINHEVYSKKYPRADIDGKLSKLHERLNKYCPGSGSPAMMNFPHALNNLSRDGMNKGVTYGLQAAQKPTRSNCDKCDQVFCACEYMACSSKSQESKNMSHRMNNLSLSKDKQSNLNKGTDKKNPINHKNLNLNALKSDNIDYQEKIRIMWTLVRQIEGQGWSKEHVKRNSNKFDCKLCDCVLSTPYDVVKHVQGKKHSDEVQDEADENRLSGDLNQSEMIALVAMIINRYKEKNIQIGVDKKVTCTKCGTTMQMKQIIEHLKGKRHTE